LFTADMYDPILERPWRVHQKILRCVTLLAK
jgi:hypothetical protein